jgi:hypothetical protein
MRVQFNHREKFRLLGPNQIEVLVSIEFSNSEKETIANFDLKDLIIIERMPTIFKDFSDQWREIDNNLYLGKFLRDAHAEPVASMAHARAFQRQMLLALEYVKSCLNHGTIAASNKLSEHQHPSLSPG